MSKSLAFQSLIRDSGVEKSDNCLQVVSLKSTNTFFCFNEGQCFNIIIKFAQGTGALGGNICNSAIEYLKSTINSKLKSQNESKLRIKESLRLRKSLYLKQ